MKSCVIKQANTINEWLFRFLKSYASDFGTLSLS